MKTDKLETGVLAFIAMCSALMGTAAVLSIVYLLIALTSVVFVPPAYGQGTPAVQLEAAISKEQVDGDLAAAIASYKKIAAQTSARRDVRAKALVHLAGCYEKLGDQAVQIYEQVLRDFADQPIAAQARARLAALRQRDRATAPVAMSLRKLEKSLGTFGAGDTDGKRAAYFDEASQTLFFGDLTGQSRHVLYHAKPDERVDWMASRDLSQVMLILYKPGRVGVVKSDGTGFREVFREASPKGRHWAANWSWDNRQIVVAWGGKLWVVSTADGARREVARTSDTGSEMEAAAFSHDGGFIAYSVVPSAVSKDRTARIFVVPVQGGEPRLFYAEESAGGTHFIDWTMDSSYLAIASAHSGQGALYLHPVKDGQPAGDPVLIRRGGFDRGFLMQDGSLIYNGAGDHNWAEAHVAALDSEGRPGQWHPLDLRGEGRWNPGPSFSPDGTQIAYSALAGEGGWAASSIVYIRDLATGKDREVFRSAGLILCRWAAQQPKLFCSQPDGQKSDLFSVAVASGEIEKLGSVKGFGWVLAVSRDDQAIYGWVSERSTQPASVSTVRFEVATRQVTVLERYPAETPKHDEIVVSPSPDGRWLYRLDDDGISIRPMAGGDWKPITGLPSGMQAQFTPDGTAILYHGVDEASRPGLYRVPVSGGQPRRVGDYPSTGTMGFLEISPDGRKAVTVSMQRVSYLETWVLENFVPKAAKR